MQSPAHRYIGLQAGTQVGEPREFVELTSDDVLRLIEELAVIGGDQWLRAESSQGRGVWAEIHAAIYRWRSDGGELAS